MAVRCFKPIALLLASAVIGPGAGLAAAADDLVYRCGPNLCKVRADGSARQQLTRDGRPGGPAYAWVSGSRDGSRLGVSFGNDGYVLDGKGRRVGEKLPDSGGAVAVVEISPDGGSVATIESLLELVNPPVPTPIPFLFLTDVASRNRETVARSTTTSGWLGGRLMRSTRASAAPFEQQICLLAVNSDFPCERLVAADPGHELWTPAGSPDGRLVVAVRAPLDGTAGPIAIYDSATGQLVRTVTDGVSDGTPAWSRDGKRIAFTRGDSIYSVSASGGRPRRVVSGVQRVWVPGQELTLSAPDRARAGSAVMVRVRAPSAPRGSRASLQRRTGSRWVTLATKSVSGGSAGFAVTLGRGRQRLRALLKAPGSPALPSKPAVVRVR